MYKRQVLGEAPRGALPSKHGGDEAEPFDGRILSVPHGSVRFGRNSGSTISTADFYLEVYVCCAESNGTTETVLIVRGS